MASSLVQPIASKVIEPVVDSIWRQIGYVWNYKDNIKSLKAQVEKLKGERQVLQHRIDEADRNGEEIEDIVKAWLSSADEAIEAAEKILHDNETGKKQRFTAWSPYLKMRYQLSRQAKKEASIAVDVRGEGKFEKISYRIPLRGIIRPAKDYMAFESRVRVFQEIMEALKDVDVNLIGVYGMGGVGKTTLAEKVAEQVKEDGLFKVVILVTVTQTVDLRRIQGEIAEWLELKFDAESNDVRAARLCARLKREETILVILDDIWERVDVARLGIPFGNDHKGCKILMTSRSQNVLSCDMCVDKCFMLQVLSDDEAWNIFEMMVGDAVKDSSLRSVAAEVAKRCAGLPILLVAVARALRNGDIHAWKDALEQLKRFDDDEMDEQVKSALTLSFNSLKGGEIKSFFLLCGRHVFYSYKVDNLLKYAVGLDLFKRSKTLEEARNRLHKYVSDLKSCCLLLEGNRSGEVKMHDVVRNFAISVASRDHHVFTAADDTILEWPPTDKHEQFTAIYLRYCDIPELPAALECSNLESFLLLSNDPMLKISDDFFTTTKKLKVLNLTEIDFETLPSSLQLLENLQTLCLEFCVLKDVTMIGELKKLRVLSFWGSTIVQLPEQIGQLTHLQLLDLSGCSSLEVIPPNVLSRLGQLQDLYMGNSFVQWEGENHEGQRKNANLAELKLLPNLVTLHIHIINAKILPTDLFSEKLERFKVVIGDEWGWSRKYKTPRMLKLKFNSTIDLGRVEVLLMRTEDLYVDDLKGVKNVLSDLDKQGFPRLKHLHIQNSNEIQYVIDSMRMGPHVAFPMLESLFLDYLIKLEKICHGATESGSFSNLKKLDVRNCNKLKNLFPLFVARGLAVLEEINVSGCKSLELIIAKETRDGSDDDEAIKLSQLRALTLENLPQLRSFSFQSNQTTQNLATDAASQEIKSAGELENLMPLFNRKITFPKLVDLKLSSVSLEKIWSNQLTEVSPCLTTLVIDECWNLNYLFTSSMVESLAHLKRLEISDCKSLKEIIVAERSGRGVKKTNILFPMLDFLKLKNLPQVRSFCTGDLIECPSLNVLQIESCIQLQTFISNSASTSNSESAQGNSTLFDEKVAFPNLEELYIIYVPELKIIWHDNIKATSFCKLKILKVEQDKSLLTVISSKLLKLFQNLESLVVKDCASLEEVFDPQVLKVRDRHDVTATQITNVSNVDPRGIISFDNLSSVTVWNCPGLKSLFPAPIARNLIRLQQLSIGDCGLEEIVSKEEGLEATTKFVFHQLESLEIWGLPKMKCFYPGMHALECPVLKSLNVYLRDGLEIFNSRPHHDVEGQPEMNQVQQSLFSSFTKGIPSLEELTLNSKDILMIRQGQFPATIFDKLKSLHLQCFHDASTNLPFDILKRFQNVQTLVLRDCYFKELFPYGIVGEDMKTVAQIRHLRLDFLPEMRHLCYLESKLSHLQYLEILEIWSCQSLINLAPSFASFESLTTLDVWGCERLSNIFTFSIAKGMLNLTYMAARECDFVQEIVANDGDKPQSRIVFRKLSSLLLHRLKNLNFFCSANCTIKFPHLEEVFVIECPKMRMFSNGVISAPELQKVYLTEQGDKWHWVKDLNTTIQHLYLEKNSDISDQE